MSIVSGFVVREGPGLALDGQPFRIAGANNYYLGYVTEPVAASVLDLAENLNLNVLRIWAFAESPHPPAAGEFCFQYFDPQAGRPACQDGPDGLERLDLAVHLAATRGIRLILALANNWQDFGGMPAYIQWFGLTGRDRFYTDGRCRAAYWQWVEQLLHRRNRFTGRLYLEEPAILAWELANEPECPTAGGLDHLLSWIWEMSTLIKSHDPNHLVSIGDQGYFRHARAGRNALFNGSYGVSCEEFLGVGPIDFGTFHMYSAMARSSDLEEFGRMWIREHVEAGQRAAKPMLLEEYGARIGEDGIADAAARARLYRHWLDTVLETRALGALVWMASVPVAAGQPYAWDPYVIGPAESEVIREFAVRLGV